MNSHPAPRTRPSATTRTTRRAGRRGAVLAGTAALGLVLAACSGGEPQDDASAAATGDASAPSETPEPTGVPAPGGFDLPDGVTLTEPGTELSIGEPATVAVEPERARGSALSLVVEGIRQGRTADLSDFVLTDRAKSSTPFYVDVAVTNEGPGNLGGYAVPLYGQFDETALVENTTFATPFQECPSTGLPRQFAPEQSVERCLVFLVPDGGDLQGVAFARAGDDPIAWSGSITPPETGGNGNGGGNGGNADGGSGGNG